MRRNVLILFLITFFTAGPLFSVPFEKESPRDIALNKKKKPDEVRPKSVFISPINATIDGTLLTATFGVDMDVIITITSLEGDGIVYSNSITVSAATVLPIYLNEAEAGLYEIEFAYSGITLIGEFVLDSLD